MRCCHVVPTMWLPLPWLMEWIVTMLRGRLRMVPCCQKHERSSVGRLRQSECRNRPTRETLLPCRPMEIRTARAADAPALLGIYRPYVESTTVSFEETAPTEDEFASRIAK